MNGSPDHDGFVRDYREGGLGVEVDDERASKLITEEGMGGPLKVNALIGVGLVLPQGLKRINRRAALRASLENESFYRNALDFGVISLRPDGE